MHAPAPQDASVRRATLREILRSVRQRRGMRSIEAAQAMGMPLRSYQHFESGRGRLDPILIHRYAKALDVDGHAILLALEIGSVDFAVQAADNKFGAILMIALQDFTRTAGRDMIRLDPRSIILTFNRTFDDLTARAREHDAYVERWMLDRSFSGPAKRDDDA